MTDAMFKDFDIILAERREKETADGAARPTFQLGGVLFTCKRKLSALAAIKLGKLALQAQLEEIISFIQLVLVNADKDKFIEVLEADDEGEIDIELLGDIINNIVEQYTGRPTQES